MRTASNKYPSSKERNSTQMLDLFHMFSPYCQIAAILVARSAPQHSSQIPVSDLPRLRGTGRSAFGIFEKSGREKDSNIKQSEPNQVQNQVQLGRIPIPVDIFYYKRVQHGTTIKRLLFWQLLISLGLHFPFSVKQHAYPCRLYNDS